MWTRIGLAGLLGLSLAGAPGWGVAQDAGKPAANAGKRWETEFSMWQKVSSGTDLAAYEDYLKQYPTGTFASMARLRIAELQAAAKSTAASAEKTPDKNVAAETPAGDPAALKAKTERKAADAEAQKRAEAEKAKAEAAEKARAEAALRREAEKAEQEAAARKLADEKAAAEAARLKTAAEAAEAKAKTEEEARLKAEAERRQAEEAAAAEKARADQEAAARREAEQQAAEDRARLEREVDEARKLAEEKAAEAERLKAEAVKAAAEAEARAAEAARLADEAARQAGKAAVAQESRGEAEAKAADEPKAAGTRELAGEDLKGAADRGEAAEAAAEKREDEIWRKAVASGSTEDFRAYLRAFPSGRFVKDARQRLAALAERAKPDDRAQAERPAPERRPVVDSREAYLDRASRAQAQRWLTLLGFDTRGADGVFGPRSRAAISGWQRSAGFRADGYLGRRQYRALREAAQYVTARENRYRRGYEILEGPRDGYPVDPYYEGGGYYRGGGVVIIPGY